jgi:hypothetical protein
MRSLSVRPQVSFTAILAGLLAIESVVLASRAYALHPLPVQWAVTFDLCAMPALMWWLLVVRPGLARPRTVARVVVLGIAISALLFGREVRLLGVPIELGILYLAFTSVRKALRTRAAADPATALREGLADALGNNAAARALAYEFTVFWYALFSWGRKPSAGFTAYKRAGWTAIYAAFALCSLGEGLGMHFLLRRFGPLASLAGIVLHVYALLWMLGDLRAMAIRPIRIEGALLRLRIGLRWEADIPLMLIESVESVEPGGAIGLPRGGADGPRRGGEVGLRLGVLGSPNLRLRLREPVALHGVFGIHRRSNELLLQVDEPAALAMALHTA